MTPQEKDLITSLLNRLRQSAQQPKDPEADALIRQGVAATPDAPYLLVQTVLIQDMALGDAQRRIKDLEQKLVAATTAPAAPQQPTSFLGRILGGGAPATGTAPAPGPWGSAPPPPAPGGSVWTRSGGPAPGPQYQPQYQQPQYQQPQYQQPLAAPGASSGFLRSAATTAAGVAGGALLFEGIQSMFGQHYGSGFMSGMPMQPGIGETVINNYYGGDNAPGAAPADYGQPGYGPPDAPPPDYTQADYNQPDPGQFDPGQADYGQQDVSDQDSGSDQDFGGGGDDNFSV